MNLLEIWAWAAWLMLVVSNLFGWIVILDETDPPGIMVAANVTLTIFLLSRFFI